MTTLFALIAAIPILDKWFEELSALYRQYKFDQAQLALARALNEKNETEDLQNQIGRQ